MKDVTINCTVPAKFNITEAARAEDIAHKKSVDGRIIQALLHIGLDSMIAEMLVERMASGHIPSVKINY